MALAYLPQVELVISGTSRSSVSTYDLLRDFRPEFCTRRDSMADLKQVLQFIKHNLNFAVVCMQNMQTKGRMNERTHLKGAETSPEAKFKKNLTISGIALYADKYSY